MRLQTAGRALGSNHWQVETSDLNFFPFIKVRFTMLNPHNYTEGNGTSMVRLESAIEGQNEGLSLREIIPIGFLTGFVSLATIVGNLLVPASFKVNKQLQTVSNYYLLSLAVADLIIGIFSMNLFTCYIVMGRWALGSVACDLWLALDYVASNASVMNLLAISFDRYFSITRPLTYRAKRTTRRAALLIGLAWTVSFVLWAPAILFWQYIMGKRTVPAGECRIQFFSEPIITFCTAVAAFYLPVSIMAAIYWRIYREIENRTRDLASLQASNFGSDSTLQRGATIGGSSRCSRPIQRCEKDLTRNSRQNSQSSEDERYVEEDRSVYSIMLMMPNDIGLYNSPNSSSRFAEAVEECSGNNLTCRIHALEEISLNSLDHSQRSHNKGGTLDNVSCGKKFTTSHKSNVTTRKQIILIREKKAARTLSAILLAFLITWTPYNIMVLVSTFCTDCVPQILWHIGYWLCYVNSTINPACYAMSNKLFRDTFKQILLCKFKRETSDSKHMRRLVKFQNRSESMSAIS
uniref:muscarinic acetylcholine receptor M1-like n=2 Tax=Myxine glutinosa TaxID=7769 RepID=UPI00358E6516